MSKDPNFILKLSIAIQEYKKDIVRTLLNFEQGLSEENLREKFKGSKSLFEYHFGDMKRYGVVTEKPPYKLNFDDQTKKELKKVIA